MISSFYQTGPGDLAGSSWEATAEGQQNFPELDSGDFYTVDSEELNFPYTQATPKQDQGDVSDDLNKWTGPSAADMKVFKSEPMRRITSKSSTGSHKHRASKTTTKKSRQRVLSPLMTRAPSQYSNLGGITGNSSTSQEATIGHGRMMDPQQYLAQDLDTLSVSSHMNVTQAFNPGMMALADGLPYADMALGFSMAQHVNPTATQIFDTGNSPHSWGSLSPETRTSSPGAADDTWSGPLVASPTDTQDSPPFLHDPSPSMNRRLDGSQLVTSEDLHGSAMPAAMCDDFSLPPPFNSRRLSGEGESARDHFLYKNASPQPDGLFHCPWEGTPSCNHKPEKLKCNYDKFVDSHLKPYRCKVESCENTRFSSTACLLRHEREAHAMHGHGDKPFLCTYEGCDRSTPGCGFPRQWNLRDHMRRVHNDNGAPTQPVAPSSPPASGTNASKGRKRKKDTQDNSIGRKSSSTKTSQGSGSAPPKAVEAPPNPDIEQWHEHKKALHALVQGWGQPEDPYFIQQVDDAQGHMAAMQKISYELQGHNGPWQRSG